MADLKFEREIRFYPAWDKRNPDPKKNYGIHGVECAFYLKGPHGVVQFTILTNWMVPHVQEEMDAKPADPPFPYLLHNPIPGDLGYHSREPLRSGKPPTKNCKLTGGDCYYDGSGLEAERMMNVLREEGDKGVWRELAIYYRAVFFDGVRAATFGETMDAFLKMIGGSDDKQFSNEV